MDVTQNQENDRWRPIENEMISEHNKFNTNETITINKQNQQTPKSLTSPKAFQDKDKPKITITFNTNNSNNDHKLNGKIISSSSNNDQDTKKKKHKSMSIQIIVKGARINYYYY